MLHLFRFTCTILRLYTMAKIKEGFKGERLVSMPEKLLEDYRKEPLIAPLYVRKIGYFPRVKYHYVQKNEGTNYADLLYRR